jgi:hypothetical protein
VSSPVKCDCAWSTWWNGDVSHLEIGDEITTNGECVQPLQSVKLSFQHHGVTVAATIYLQQLCGVLTVVAIVNHKSKGFQI